MATKTIIKHNGNDLGSEYPPILLNKIYPRNDPKSGVVRFEIMTNVAAEAELAPTASSRKTVIHVYAPQTMNQNIARESVMKTNDPFENNPAIV